MTDRLVHRSMNRYLSLEVSEDKRNIGIFTSEKSDEVVEFSIEEVWDMLRDTLATMDISPNDWPGLFRRKGEAIAGLQYAHIKHITEERP